MYLYPDFLRLTVKLISNVPPALPTLISMDSHGTLEALKESKAQGLRDAGQLVKNVEGTGTMK